MNDIRNIKKQLSDFKNRHKGETIYVIGSSPSLNNLSSKEISFLKDKVTIGVNFSIEGINHLKYLICAHIAPAIYSYEYHNTGKTTFFVQNGGLRSEAFSYLKDFWSDKNIVSFVSSPPKIPLKIMDNSNEIQGSTSILLQATHLAYFMGAKKIVYVGFDETTKEYFWSYNSELEKKIANNIDKILLSKKYFVDNKFYKNDPWNRCHNVHKEFEFILGRLPGVPPCHFFLTEDERKKDYWGSSWTAPKEENIKNFRMYNFFLHKKGIRTYTRSKNGITTLSGCRNISTVIE